MPIVLLKAEDLGVTGYESHEALTANSELRKQLERIRLKLGPKMNLGDVTDKVVPKMCLIAPSRAGGAITTRTFIPHVCHSAVGVLGAVTVATACMMEGTVAHDLADLPPGNPKMMSIEHPTGEFSVEIEMDRALHEPVVKRSALLRTTRSLMEGHALIPANVWEGKGE
jgi:4-oxalomesaconate tautomerase